MLAISNARQPAPRPAQIFADFGLTYFANGLIGFIFSATGPVAIIPVGGHQRRPQPAELASWVFGCSSSTASSPSP